MINTMLKRKTPPDEAVPPASEITEALLSESATEDRPAAQPNTQSEIKGATLSRSVINFWLDCLLAVLFLLLFWVAMVIRFAFPPGPSAEGWTLWGWNYTQWSDAHFAILCLSAFAILVHVMLHWSWVCGVLMSQILRRKDGRRRTIDDGTRTVYGVGLMIVLLNVLGLALAAAVVMIQGPA